MAPSPNPPFDIQQQASKLEPSPHKWIVFLSQQASFIIIGIETLTQTHQLV